MTHFMVVGRRRGADESEALDFESEQAMDAAASFVNEMRSRRGLAPLSRAHFERQFDVVPVEQQVFVEHVFASNTEIEEVTHER